MFAALLPIVIVSIVQGFGSYNNIRNLEIRRMEANAKAVAERQRDPFVIAQHLLMSIASNPEVREYGDGCKQALASGLRSYAPSVNFVRADASGLVRCSVLPYEDGATLATEPWWQAGIRKQELTITPHVVGSISRKNVLIMMLPVRTADNRQHGSVSTAVEIGFLANGLRNAPESKTGIFAIVSSSGEIVAQGRQALPFKPDMTSALSQKQNVQTANGEQWIYTSAKLYGPGLFVVYAEPREGTMAAAISQFRITLISPLLSILLASLAIWFGTNRLVVRWLRDLGHVTNRFAQGEFTSEREKFEHAPREIAELSVDLQAMADVIDKKTTDLTLALEEKSGLTREVHHRVKNNLQIITSLLTLQAARVAESQAKGVLDQTRARISALALIHRLLYEHDNGNEQGEVAIDALMTELCAQLRSGNRGVEGVDLVCNTTKYAVPADYAVPLALFAVEAVTNAYRHAFGPGKRGAVRLEFKAEDNDAVLTVSDNGRGYAVEKEAGQMGTELMYAFASQVNGELDISSTIDGGTSVSLRFRSEQATVP